MKAEGEGGVGFGAEVSFPSLVLPVILGGNEERVGEGSEFVFEFCDGGLLPLAELIHVIEDKSLIAPRARAVKLDEFCEKAGVFFCSKVFQGFDGAR